MTIRECRFISKRPATANPGIRTATPRTGFPTHPQAKFLGRVLTQTRVSGGSCRFRWIHAPTVTKRTAKGQRPHHDYGTFHRLERKLHIQGRGRNVR